MTDVVIEDVSDTALWVAAYRARETERPDALFHDRLAARLAGERGKKIAETMGHGRYIAGSVVVRTCIIDSYIGELIAGGVDTVLNLGAGLDTRPYRLELPSSLRWIEVDLANIIDLKEDRLRAERPRCRLRRVRLDLADRPTRRKLFADVSSRAAKVAILTEGVIPYLDNAEVASLADDLRAEDNFRFWIVDYCAPALTRLVRWSGLARGRMKNAPFRFHPDDPFGFFGRHGWHERETRYLAVEAQKLGRPFPRPWWAPALLAFIPKQKRKMVRGYTLLEPI